MIPRFRLESLIFVVVSLSVLFALTPALVAQTERSLERQREAFAQDEFERRETESGLSFRAEETLQDFEFDYGGWARSGIYHLRDFSDHRNYRVQDMRLWSSLIYRDTHQLYVRVMGLYTDYNDQDEYSYMSGDEDDLNAPRLDIGYYYGDLGKAFSLGIEGKLRAKAGRQYVTIGEGLALDVRGDGLAMEYEDDNVKLTGFALRSVYSEDSYDRTYPDFGHNKFLYSGAEVVKKFSEVLELYGYSVFMNDKRETKLPLAVPQKFRYNAGHFGAGLRGQIGPALMFHGEYTRELGRRYSSGTVERSDIDAYAYDLEVSYAFVQSELEPKISFQHLFGSGDHDTGVTVDTVGGNMGGTNDNTFFSYGYINTGFVFFPLISNIEINRIGLDLTPCKDHPSLGDLEVGVNYFTYRKHESKGGISDRGLDLTSDTSGLGYETDFFVTWRPFSDVLVTAQYGLFVPDSDAFTDSDKRPFYSLGVMFYF